MTDQVAVSIKKVSKKYRLFNSPKERFLEAFHPFNKKYHREFWALKDVDIEIMRGQTIGIIGRNGSGKSTLLQIICSILKPTSGDITVSGRISALLELGAGFNPEFTGRENVFINGALMGFSQKEMKERMSDIESFADIGEFIDQPVKIYSSGMFVRLAFACAINVNPDILVVDEALAVGDAKFQHKCYQKFIEFQEAGKTVILVTHDMGAVVKHCDYAFLLENGAIIKSGSPKDIVNYYLELVITGKHHSEKIQITERQKENEDKIKEIDNPDIITIRKFFFNEIPHEDNCKIRSSYNKTEYRYGDKRGEIVDYLIICDQDSDINIIHSGDLIEIYVKIRFFQPVNSLLYGFSIKTLEGIVVYASNTRYFKGHVTPVKGLNIVIIKVLLKMSLHAGEYFIDLGVAEKIIDKDEPIDRRCGIIHFTVLQHNKPFDGIVELESDIQEICNDGIQ